MASPHSAHTNEPSNWQESAPGVRRQQKPIVPIIPRELEKKNRNVTTKLAATRKTEHSPKIADVKAEEATSGTTKKSSKKAGGAKTKKPKSSGVFAVPEIPPFKPKNNLKQITVHSPVSEHDPQSTMAAKGEVNAYCLNTRAKVLPVHDHAPWLEHGNRLPPPFNPIHGPIPQEQELLVADEYEKLKSWSSLTPEEPLSTPSHHSSAQTPLQQSHVSSFSSFSTGAATGGYDYSRHQSEPFCYQPTALDYGFTPYSQAYHPQNPFLKNYPYRFDKPFTPSTTPSENQSGGAAKASSGQIMGENEAYSPQDNQHIAKANGYGENGSAEDVVSAQGIDLPASLDGTAFHTTGSAYDSLTGTTTNLPAMLNGNAYNGNAYYADGLGQGVQSATGIDSLVGYLLQHVNNPEYADCDLEICVGDETAHVKVHALVVGQSPLLRTLVSSTSYNADTGMKHTGLRTSSKYGSVAAFVATLRVLYGADPYETFGNLCNQQNVDPMAPLETTTLNTAIAFLFAGNALEIPQVQAVGMDAINRNVSFDGLEKMFAFAFDSESKISTFSATSSVDNDEVTFNGAFQRAYTNTQIINSAVQFMAYNFPRAFVLDTTVPSIISLGAPTEHPGFPQVQSSAKLTSRLCSIRFGDMPIENESIPDNESTILSKILLSLPEQYVYGLFDQLGGWLSPQMCSSVREERKKRFEVGSTHAGKNGQMHDEMNNGQHEV